MENNDVIDPLEREMQALDSSNTESSSYCSQIKELPHRPIILPPLIKEEPGHNLTACATTTTEPSQVTSNVNLSSSTTPTRGIESNTNETQATASGAVCSSATESLRANASITPTTQNVLLDPNIRIKQERLEDDSAVKVDLVPKQKHKNRLNEETDGSPAQPIQQGEAVIRIKSEPVDKTATVEDYTMPPSNQASTKNQSATQDATMYSIRAVVEENKNTEAGKETLGGSAELPPQGDLITTNKSKPVGTILASEGSTIQSSNQATANNETIAQNSSEQSAPTVLSENKNTDAVEQELDEVLPDNFFDDLLQDADNITAAALQATATSPEPEAARKETNAPVIKSEPLDNPTVSEVTQSAPIPENFFDDLLVDHAAERVEDVVNHGLEIKYSERLKELQKLESIEQFSNKAHKKHKKKKKKSRKRTHPHSDEEVEPKESGHKRKKNNSRSHSRSPTTHSQLIQSRNRSPDQQLMRTHIKNEPLEARASPQRSGSLFPHDSAQSIWTRLGPMGIANSDPEKPETSAEAAKRDMRQKSCGTIRVKSEFATFPIPNSPDTAIDESSDMCLPVHEKELFQRRIKNNRNELIIDLAAPLGFKRIKLENSIEKSTVPAESFMLPKDKIEHAKQRAIAAIEEFKKANKQNSALLSPFLYTTTVLKLPKSNSHITQQIHENRSPLHNVNNVLYKFNSHANQFNLREWGLQEMPKNAAKVAKILGFDAHALEEKLQTAKLPMGLQKIERENLEQQSNAIIEPQPTFLITVSTQTHNVTVLEPAEARRKTGHDIAVQTIPVCNSIATQTAGAALTANNSYDDLPLMQQIKSLNESQLMALSDFAELLSEPAPASGANAMDMYRLRQRMMDIYKCSQLPSAFAPHPQEPTQIVSMRPNIPRDPRRDRMMMLQESAAPPPQPPALRQTHIRHPSQPPHHRLHQGPAMRAHPLQRAPQQWPAMPPHSQEQPPLPAARTIPVISNVQSYHPTAIFHPPPDATHGPASKYFGRGGMRR
ncbi:uncharacterized protein LOC129238785 [Anastrepha obliqua]|uniref:uncharacterized protein LOC129238785 n=1 Tax=Anastrepha obliqua TaxID=95512 RepID=UPI00240A0675|nr:uncharacterized protein LOC129238785 [Anastrepha obliqua]